MAASKLVYQFKVTLLGVRPAIWRRIQLPGSYSFWDLHVAIQDAMGWDDSHLHAFRLQDLGSVEPLEAGIPADDFEADTITGWEVKVRDHFRAPKDKILYEYDFGDGWEHEVLLEAIAERESGRRYPVCLAGARACPPEDCGGVHRFARLLRIIRNPSHGEHEETMDWLGDGYDPRHFDAGAVRFAGPLRRWKLAFGEE